MYAFIMSQQVQVSQHQGNVDCLMHDDTCKCESGRDIGHISASNLACFAMEVFHLKVKDCVVFDKKESMWNIPAVIQSIEIHSDILHFFGNGICPKGRARTSVNDQGIIHQHWQGGILVCLLQVLEVAAFNKGDDRVSLLEDMEHPPVETEL